MAKKSKGCKNNSNSLTALRATDQEALDFVKNMASAKFDETVIRQNESTPTLISRFAAPWCYPSNRRNRQSLGLRQGRKGQ